ncbi:MAG: PfkB family carbohydrate kinase, partial [Chloroflexota bacterium]
MTVTPNTSLDHIMFVPSFGLNETIRASQVVQSMGGKPTDASWILGELGVPSLALGFAAGNVGQQVESLLHQRNVTTDFIWVEGESRRNIVIICEDGSGQSTITDASLKFNQADIQTLIAQYKNALSQTTC